ncbi:MAG: methyltransferase domain-containing protein [Thermomicrobiales bacterium]
MQKLPPGSRFDVVVSGYAIHHLPNERKQALFREILEMLQPGGLFINLEHVATRSPMARQLFDDMFIDNQTELTRSRGETVNRDEIARRYHTREDQHDNILALVEDQCIWMDAAGFVDVDCYFKILELAMLAGRRPE